MKTTTKAHLAALAANFFFAANYGLVKYISPSLLGPYGLNILRVGGSLLLFWLVWIFGKTAAGIKKEHVGRFLLCALMGVSINQMSSIKGITMTSTIHASLLALCTPLLVTFFAFWMLKEKLTVFKAIGLILGIGGALLLILSKEKTGATSSLTGDLLIVLNAIAYTVYFIMVKPLMKVYPPLHVIRWVFTLGFFMILPFGWMQFSEIQWQHFTGLHFAALAFIVVCATFLAYFFNVYGIRYLGAGVAGTYIYTQPVFATIIAALFLQEQFTFQKVAAGILIFIGVYLTGMKKSRVLIPPKKPFGQIPKTNS